MAGSMANFVIDGQDAILTTRGVFPDGGINTTNGALGINAVAGSDTASAFDDGESWVFDWSIDTLFRGIDFQLFSTPTEQFRLQNSDWIGLSFTPQDSNITFDGLLGEFTFASNDSTDNFDLTDLSNGTPLPVSAGSDLTLTFLTSAADNASLQSLTFASSTSVPEPGTLALASLAGLAYLGYAGFQKHRQNRAESIDSGAFT
ncbi:MAG TPA: hypothetical protein VMM76_22460 [Pirellulaceae bacterium]|nr:hypothetical protein [Pirellulaceae bacterium]